MSTLQLIRHGANIKPHYAPAPGESESWAGKSTDAERSDGNISGIVKRYSKHESASDKVQTAGLITRVGDDAVYYASPAEIGLRGLSMIGGLFSLGLLLVILPRTWELIFRGDLFAIVFGSLTTIAFTVTSITIFLWTLRLELFQPIDQPTIFDRKHRKVYRVFSESQPGWFGLFKPWPMRACEYDWDLIDVEHNASVLVTGSMVRRDHTLIFIVRRSADDPTVIDSFNIGNSLFVIDEAVDSAWEHIRRFMEENGPPLPHGVSLPEPAPRKGLGARLLQVTPFSRVYWEWWRTEFPTMLLAHAVLPFTVVFIGLWIFFGWLAIKTARPIRWPAEVVAAVGLVVAAPTTKQMV